MGITALSDMVFRLTLSIGVGLKRELITGTASIEVSGHAGIWEPVTVRERGHQLLDGDCDRERRPGGEGGQPGAITRAVWADEDSSGAGVDHTDANL